MSLPTPHFNLPYGVSMSDIDPGGEPICEECEYNPATDTFVLGGRELEVCERCLESLESRYGDENDEADQEEIDPET